jgi:hypothetical protein
MAKTFEPRYLTGLRSLGLKQLGGKNPMVICER